MSKTTMNGADLSERLRVLHERAGISRLADVTGLDTLGIPVVSAIRPGSRSLSVMSGRGSTLEQARIAATMEALEAYAAESFAPRCVRARYRELTVPAVDPETLPHTANAQLGGELWWCPARGLITGAEVLVPFESIHTDWTRAADPAGLALDSNGIGAGLDRESAIRHGLLELIERDALAMASVRVLAAGGELPVLSPALAPQSVGPATTRIVAGLRSAGAGLHLVDLRSETGIPVVAAVVLDEFPNPFRVLPVAMGVAAAPDLDEAATRALTEAAQSRLVTISGGRDDLVPAEYDRMIDSAADQLLRERLNELGPGGTAARPADAPTELDWLAAAVQAVGGQEPLVVELAQYPLATGEVQVVRVLAPGLEGSGIQMGVASAPGRRAAAVMEACR